jgi:hypothetical protein
LTLFLHLWEPPIVQNRQLPPFSKSQSYVTTDGQSASLSWCQAPIWGLRPDFYCCQTVAGLLMWGALSDERTGLPFTIAAGPRQRSHFRVPSSVVLIFTVSYSRLPFPSPPTTRRATVEVFDPASTPPPFSKSRLYFYATDCSLAVGQPHKRSPTSDNS